MKPKKGADAGHASISTLMIYFNSFWICCLQSMDVVRCCTHSLPLHGPFLHHRTRKAHPVDIINIGVEAEAEDDERKMGAMLRFLRNKGSGTDRSSTMVSSFF